MRLFFKTIFIMNEQEDLGIIGSSDAEVLEFLKSNISEKDLDASLEAEEEALRKTGEKKILTLAKQVGSNVCVVLNSLLTRFEDLYNGDSEKYIYKDLSSYSRKNQTRF